MKIHHIYIFFSKFSLASATVVCIQYYTQSDSSKICQTISFLKTLRIKTNVLTVAYRVHHGSTLPSALSLFPVALLCYHSGLLLIPVLAKLSSWELQDPLPPPLGLYSILSKLLFFKITHHSLLLSTEDLMEIAGPADTHGTPL